MLRWTEVCQLLLNSPHAVLIPCHCRPCKMIQMCITQSVPLFSLHKVYCWKFQFTCVCTDNRGHHLLHTLVQSRVVCVSNHVPGQLSGSSAISHSIAVQSGAEACDTWTQRWHWHMKRLLCGIENFIVLYSITFLKLDSNSSLSCYRRHKIYLFIMSC